MTMEKTSLQDKIVGHEKVFKFWRDWRGSSGCFAFAGPQGVGKAKTAWALAQNSLCDRDQNPACGVCGSCRRVAQKQHEGILFVQPENEVIKLEKAREIVHELSLRAISKKRFVIVDGAQALNSQAANALLKTLEEPPPDCFIFLITPNIRALLPTIRSRSIPLRFFPLTSSQLASINSYPEWVLRASRGQVHRAEEWLKSENQEARARAAGLFLELLDFDQMIEGTAWRSWIKDKALLIQACELWLELLQDASLLQMGFGEELCAPDLKEFSQKLAALPSRDIEHKIKQILVILSETSIPKDSQIMLESLSSQWSLK